LRVVFRGAVSFVLVAMAVVVAGCASDHAGSGGDFTPTVAESVARRQTREHADQVAAAMGVSGYAGGGQEERLSCPGQISDYPDDSLYRIRGSYQLAVAADEQKAAYRRLAERWKADGLEPRAGGTGDPWVGDADLKVGTMDHFEISVTGGGAVRLLVVSTCLHEG
jgi:hypothetical protein